MGGGLGKGGRPPRSKSCRASFVAAYQCNAGLPPATPKGGRRTPHLLSPGPCAASKRPLPPRPRRLPAAERIAGNPADHGVMKPYKFDLKLRASVVRHGSTPSTQP